MSLSAIKVYRAACEKENITPIEEFLEVLESNAKAALLSNRSSPLGDLDLVCIAAAVRALEEDSALKVLNLEDNGFGLKGLQALMEAVEKNPGHIRELRLGRNNLKDEGAVMIGHTLSRHGCGLKVLDLSENGITKSGVIPIAAALEHSTSDIVELSFHNNKIEGDAASFLGKAIRVAAKLKHLHLGYNALRDSGAEQLAQSIPHARLLSTLDLTANRIGHAGGVALAEALLEDGCSLQRLNLRHNKLDSEAICRFGEVLRTNTSLIQLFLGYMNPSPEAVTVVLDALRENQSLLLLDIFGWKIASPRAADLIKAIQEDNTVVAAIVSDACDTVAKSIDLQNADREDRNLHPIYVGPDDRDAYLATKSLKRYSRAQSRRQSRVASARQSVNPSRNMSVIPANRQIEERSEGSRRRRHRSSSRGGATEDGEKSEGSRRRRHRSRGASEAGEEGQRSRRNGEVEEEGRSHRRHRSRGASEAGDDGQRSRRNGEVEEEGRSRRHRRSSRSTPAAEEGALVVRPLEICDVPGRTEQHTVHQILRDMKQNSVDPKGNSVVHDLAENLQKQIEALRAAHEKDRKTLLARIEALEARKECRCSSGSGENNNANSPLRKGTSVENTGSGGQRPFQRSGSNPSNSSINYFTQPNSNASPTDPSSQENRPAFTNSQQPSALRGSGAYNTSLPSSAVPYRSLSRMSEGYPERSMTPLVKPNTDNEDVPPNVAQGNDEQGERKPDEPGLQRSASVVNYPPRIEPSPARDHNPPRRKSVSVNY